MTKITEQEWRDKYQPNHSDRITIDGSINMVPVEHVWTQKTVDAIVSIIPGFHVIDAEGYWITNVAHNFEDIEVSYEKSAATFNHMFTIAFEVSGSTDPSGGDVTASRFRAALERRMDTLDSEGDLAWDEAIGGPQDTFKEQ